jgi:7-cyano-7-deazaguanine reductase
MIYEDRVTDLIEQKAKKLLGKTFLAKDIDRTVLQTIPYEYPHRKIMVELETEEFTCLCPYSGLPDFARITIHYTPHKALIELKALKYYLYSFRNIKIYNEHVVNKILDDLTFILKPHRLTIIGEFNVRGGATNKVTAHYKKR